jgi:hypothetical protein
MTKYSQDDDFIQKARISLNYNLMLAVL